MSSFPNCVHPGPRYSLMIFSAFVLDDVAVIWWGAFLVERCAGAKALACGNLGWGDEEARRLAAAIEHAHANDALQALVTLDLSLNKIGDDGLRHLGDAVSHGAAPALKTLLLSGNAASDAARQAVEDALKLRS